MISFIHKLGKRICRLHRARTTAWTLAITALALIFGVAPIRAQNAPGDRARAIERARGHDLPSTIVGADRLPLDGLVGSEILVRDEAAPGFHGKKTDKAESN